MHKITITKNGTFPISLLIHSLLFLQLTQNGFVHMCASVLENNACVCPLIVPIRRSRTIVLFRHDHDSWSKSKSRWTSSLSVTHSHPCSSLLIVDQKAHLQNPLQKSLNRRSSFALASGTLIQSVSAYSSKLRVSPENPNFGTIGGFSSFDLTPSQSIVLKKLKWKWKLFNR